MTARFEKLLEPGKIGKIRTRNRIIKTGAGMAYARDSWVTDEYKAFYGAIARGGVGLIIVEEADCDYPLGTAFADGTNLRIDEDRFIPSLAELAQVIHKYECPTFLQLLHNGPWHASVTSGMQPVSASFLAEDEVPKQDIPGWKYTAYHELTITEIESIILKFAMAAERAKKAGFDGVEINGASGHLINSFLSRIYNKRQDKFGCQSTENRCRFLTEIVRAIKQRVGQDFPVGVLYNGSEFGFPKGTTLEEAKEFARLLEHAGVDVIQIRAYGYGPYNDIQWPESIFHPEPPNPFPKELDGSRHGAGLTVPIAAAIKKVVTIPVTAVGRLDPELGEKILRDGKVDFIAMTRRLIADPELPHKVAASNLSEIRPCTACLHCADLTEKPTSCRIDAAVGAKEDYEIKAATKLKKVVVVGGGPSGLEAARVAAIRGHQVTLFEKLHMFGGLIPIAAMVQGLEIENKVAIIRYFKVQLEKLGVEVRQGEEFTSEMADRVKPDVVIIAAGGVTASFDIPGIARSNVIILSHLDKMLRPMLKIFGPGLVRWATKFYMPGGEKIIVIGGTFYGCELAEFLVKRGKKVTLVHSGPYESLGEGLSMIRKWPLISWLRRKGVNIITDAKYEEINDKGLLIITKEGDRRTIEADSIMPSTLLNPNTDLLLALNGKVSEVFVIGDSRKSGLIKNAIADGYRTACSI